MTSAQWLRVRIDSFTVSSIHRNTWRYIDNVSVNEPSNAGEERE